MKFNTFVEGDSDDKESIRKTIGLRSSQAVENDLHNLEMGKFYELNKDYLKA